MMLEPTLKINFRVRAMKETDLEQVMAIDRLSFSMPWPARSFRYELQENQHSMQWVAESAVSGDILGFIVVWLILDEAHIATFAVHPDYRRQGIARVLLLTALEAVIQRGLVQATLEVRTSNLSAQQLYEQFGFEIAGRRRRYYKDNQEDAVIMTAHGLGLDYLNNLDSFIDKGGPYER